MEPSKALVTTRTLLERQKGEFARALGNTIPSDFFVRVALTTIRKNPALLSCTEQSLLASLMDAAQLRLVPDSNLGHAYLVPFRDEAKLIIGYRGYIELIRRGTRIANLHADVVRAEDTFSFSYGSDRHLRHVPNYEVSDRGPRVCAYAYVAYTGEAEDFIVLPEAYLQKVKAFATSRSEKAGQVWKGQWEDEMCIKTAVLRLSKVMQLGSCSDFQAALSKEFDENVIDIPAETPVKTEPSKLVEPEPSPVPTAETPTPPAEPRRGPGRPRKAAAVVVPPPQPEPASPEPEAPLPSEAPFDPLA